MEVKDLQVYFKSSNTNPCLFAMTELISLSNQLKIERSKKENDERRHCQSVTQVKYKLTCLRQ